MIEFSPRLQWLLSQDDLETFHCIQIKDFYLTNYHRDITLTNGGTYVTSSVVAGIEAPKLDSSVDRTLYRISLSDSSFIFLNLYETNLIGAPVSVRLVIVDPETGKPEVNEPILIYQGIVQGFDQKFETGQAGELSATLSCSNVMAALDATRSFYTTKERLAEIAPGDTAFDQVYEDSGRLVLGWGKK
jgi:hypothetical protein